MVAHARVPLSLRVCAYALSDAGLVRATNEDAFGMADLGSAQPWRGGAPARWTTSAPGILLEVSDGMGGAMAGEVASALSIEGVLRGMLDAARRGRVDGEALRRVIASVSRRVHEAGKHQDRRGMGATLTAALIQGECACVAQIGDSRAYRIRGDEIDQVTHDQSYVQVLVDAGVMTPEEAMCSPRRNIVLQCMGQESVDVALGWIEVRRGDRLLLCSDGLTNVLDPHMIRDVVRSPNDIDLACDELVRRTHAFGAPDNVTVILADLA